MDRTRLVLTRGMNETIDTSNGISVTVVRIDRSRVRLLVEASPLVKVLRREIGPPRNEKDRETA